VSMLPLQPGVIDRGDSCEGGSCALRPVPLHGDASWDRADTRLGRDVQVLSQGGNAIWSMFTRIVPHAETILL
jgi:hypothetical protein